MSSIYVWSCLSNNSYYFYRYNGIGTIQQIGRYTPGSVFYERKYGRKHPALRIAKGTLELRNRAGRSRMMYSLESHIDRLKFFCDNGSVDPQDSEMLKSFQDVAREWA